MYIFSMAIFLNGCFRTHGFCSLSLVVFVQWCIAATSDKNPAAISGNANTAVNPQSVLVNDSDGGHSSAHDTRMSIGQIVNKAVAPISAPDSPRAPGAGFDTTSRTNNTCGARSGKNDTLRKAGQSSPEKPLKVRKRQAKDSPKTAYKLSPAVRVIVLLLSIALIAMVVRFVRKTNNRPVFLSTTRLSIMDKEVQKTCRYIEKNFAKTDLSVAKICSDLVTGGAFLEALFEKELGLSVDQFISHVRINRARIFMENNLQADAETVGLETGFATPAAFVAAFKKIVGMSFEEYRGSRGGRETVNG